MYMYIYIYEYIVHIRTTTLICAYICRYTKIIYTVCIQEDSNLSDEQDSCCHNIGPYSLLYLYSLPGVFLYFLLLRLLRGAKKFSLSCVSINLADRRIFKQFYTTFYHFCHFLPFFTFFKRP